MNTKEFHSRVTFPVSRRRWQILGLLIALAATGSILRGAATVAGSGGQVIGDSSLPNGIAWWDPAVIKTHDPDGDNRFGSAGYWLFKTNTSPPIVSGALNLTQMTYSPAPWAGLEVYDPSLANRQVNYGYRQFQNPSGGKITTGYGGIYAGPPLTIGQEYPLYKITILPGAPRAIGLTVATHPEVSDFAPTALRVRATFGGANAVLSTLPVSSTQAAFTTFLLDDLSVGDEFVIWGQAASGYALMLNGIFVDTASALPAHTPPPPPLLGGNSWKNLDLRGMGFVTGLVTHPATGEIYARTDVGGIFRWQQSRCRWLPLLDAASNTVDDFLNVESIALDPSNPDKIIIAYGAHVEDGIGADGILISMDKGATWFPGSLPATVHMGGNSYWRHCGERLAIDPNNPAIVYFGSRQNGLWRSTDGGLTWSYISGVPHGDNGGAFRNSLPVNGGITWVAIDPSSTVSGPTRSAVIYLGIMGAGVYRSIDGGSTFSLLGTMPDPSLNPVQGRLASDGSLYVSLSPDVSVPGGGAVWRWNGSAWSVITPPIASFTYTPRNWAALAVSPDDPARVAVQAYNTSARDLFLSSNGGSTWEIVTTDLPIMFPPGSHRAANFLIPPWWDVNDHRFTFSGSLLFEQGNPNRLFSSTGWAVYCYENLDDTDVIVDALNYMRGLEELVATRAVPRQPASGGGFIGGVMDMGGFTVESTATIPADNIGTAAIANATGIAAGAFTSTAYISLASGNHDAGEVLRSDDHGLTWYAVNNSPFGYPTGYGMTLAGDLAVSAHNPNNVVWIPLNPTWYPNWHPPVFSTDGGTTWSASAGIPAQFSGVANSYYGANNVVAADGLTPGVFYAYHENLGPPSGDIYRSTDGGANWTKVSSALPPYWKSTLSARPGKAGELWYSNRVNTLRVSWDAGVTWDVIPGFSRVICFGFGAPIPPLTKTTIYVVGERSSVLGLYYSLDDGMNWNLLTGAGLPPFTSSHSISGDLSVPGRVYLAVGGRGFFTINILPHGVGCYDLHLKRNHPTLASPHNLPGSDPDADGVPNLLEYALGGSFDSASDHYLLPAVSTFSSPGAEYLTLTFTPATLDCLTYEIIASNDMISWTVAANVTPSLSVGIPFTYTDTVNLLLSASRFLALRVTHAPSPTATVTTIPVGWVSTVIQPGTGSAKVSTGVSAGLPAQSVNVGSQTGRIAAITANTITASGAGWISGALASPTSPHVLRITSGAATGHTFLISANTSNKITIHPADVAIAPLTSLGIVAGPLTGDTFRIEPCDTLLSLLGTPLTTGVLAHTAPASADTVVVHSPHLGTQTYFYHSGFNYWVRNTFGFPNANNTPIRPDTGLQYQRLAATPMKLGYIGVVPHTTRRAWVRNSGQTSLAQGWPIAITLNSANIPAMSGWTPGSTPTVADILAHGVMNYFWDGSVWRRQAFGFPVSNPTLPAASAQYFNKKGSAPGCAVLQQTPPYTLP